MSITSLQRLAVPASESRPVITNLNPGLHQGRKRCLFLGNDPWEPKVLFLSETPTIESLIHLFLTMGFHLRNSGHFLSLIFLRLVPAETLIVRKASVTRCFTPFKKWWVETKGGISFVKLKEKDGVFIYFTLMCLAFPRLKVMGFISLLWHSRLLMERLTRIGIEAESVPGTSTQEIISWELSFSFFLKCQA